MNRRGVAVQDVRVDVRAIRPDDGPEFAIDRNGPEDLIVRADLREDRPQSKGERSISRSVRSEKIMCTRRSPSTSTERTELVVCSRIPSSSFQWINGTQGLMAPGSLPYGQ